MKKLLGRLVWVPLGLALVIFLVANRHPVAISLDPFSTDTPSIISPTLPLWFWLSSFLLAGFFLGVFASWSSGRAKRLEAKENARAVKDLERENQVLAAQSTAEAPLIVADV
ncbi:MAG: LapA family protein [Pseudomonadota bacterium]